MVLGIVVFAGSDGPNKTAFSPGAISNETLYRIGRPCA